MSVPSICICSIFCRRSCTEGIRGLTPCASAACCCRRSCTDCPRGISRAACCAAKRLGIKGHYCLSRTLPLDDSRFRSAPDVTKLPCTKPALPTAACGRPHSCGAASHLPLQYLCSAVARPPRQKTLHSKPYSPGPRTGSLPTAAWSGFRFWCPAAALLSHSQHGISFTHSLPTSQTVTSHACTHGLQHEATHPQQCRKPASSLSGPQHAACLTTQAPHQHLLSHLTRSCPTVGHPSNTLLLLVGTSRTKLGCCNALPRLEQLNFLAPSNIYVTAQERLSHYAQLLQCISKAWSSREQQSMQ